MQIVVVVVHENLGFENKKEARNFLFVIPDHFSRT